MSRLINKFFSVLPSHLKLEKVAAILAGTAVVSLLSACGGGSSSDTDCSGATCGNNFNNVQAGGVKGPLTNVDWALEQAGVAGNLLSGSNETEFLFDLGDIPSDVSTPLLLTITADSGTTDATTGVAPVITVMKTLVSIEMLRSGKPILVTPLSTLATDLLIDQQINSAGGPASFAEFSTADLNALTAGSALASSQVMNVFGLGASQNIETQAIDVFTQSPIFQPSDTFGAVVSKSDLAKIVQFRKANEAFATALFDTAADPVVSADTMTVYANVLAAFSDRQLITADDDGSAATDGVAEFITQLGGYSDSTVIANSSPSATLGGLQSTIFGAADLNVTGQVIDDDPNVETPTELLISSFSPNGIAPIPSSVSVPTASTDPEDPAGDTDGDGVLNNADFAPLDPRVTASTDVNDDDNDSVANFIDNCNFEIGTDFFGTNPNPNQADSDGDGVGDVCDANPDDPTRSNDADEDTVTTGADNCPNTANTNQLNFDGDAQGDACDDDDDNDGFNDDSDDAPFDPMIATDPDGDGIDTLGAPFTGPDNCPSDANPGQENLDQALVDGDINLIIAAVAAQGRAVDSAGAQDWIDSEAEYAESGAYVADGLGDECDNDIDGDGRILDTPPTPDLDDVNPDPLAVDATRDLDSDGFIDFAKGGDDNCDGVSNADQANFDAQQEADALGVDISMLGAPQDPNDPNAPRFSGVGDACDRDIDNDGVANLFTDPDFGPSGAADDPDPQTPAELSVFADELAVNLVVGVDDTLPNVRFALEADSSSDIVSSGSINVSSNNILQFSKGAALDDDDAMLLDRVGEAGEAVPLYMQNRPVQSILASLGLTSAADCSLDAPNGCTIAEAAATATLNDTNFSAVSANDLEFGVIATPDGFDIQAVNELETPQAGERNYIQNEGGKFWLFGDSWVGRQRVTTDVYIDDMTCADAITNNPIDSDPATDDEIALASCNQLAQETSLGLRVFARQGAAPALGANAENNYGLVEIDLGFSSSVGGDLVDVRTSVNEANGGDARSEFSTTRGVNVDGFSITRSEANDSARVLAADANTDGQVSLGNLNGFTGPDASLLVLADSDTGTATATNTVKRAYGVLLDTTTPASDLFNSSYDVTGLFLQGSAGGFAASQWLANAGLELVLESCATAPTELQATFNARTSTIGAAYREGDSLFPNSNVSNVEIDFTSECFTLSSGRFSPINFIPNANEGTQLQLEGYLGQDGLLIRAVRAVAKAPSGGTTTEDFLLLFGYDDSIGSTPGVPENGEVQTTDIWVNLDSQDAVCNVFGQAPGCNLQNGQSLVYLGPELDSTGTPTGGGTVFRTVIYTPSVEISSGGGGGGTDFGFVDLPSAVNGAQGQAEVDAAGALPAYDDYTVGQGILFAIPN